LAARMSTCSIFGGCDKSSLAFAIRAATTRPFR
jgi:hypothetical protein